LREVRRLRVFENGVLTEIFGAKRDEVTGEWSKLHDEELNSLYCSPNVVRVIKSRTMRWVLYVARMGRGEFCTGRWWENLRERDHWGEPVVDVRIILWRILRKWDAWLWTGLSWLRIGTGVGTCECGNEHSGSIIVGEFSD
jgi:hypothetical protein